MAAFTFFKQLRSGSREPSESAPAAKSGARRAECDRIAQAIRYGAGYVAVIGNDVEDTERVVDEAIEKTGFTRILRFSATTAKVNLLAREMCNGSSETGNAAPLVAVVNDADLASVKQLELLRVQLESCVPGTGALRIVLIGGSVLQRILDLPSAKAITSRLGLRLVLSERRSRFSRA